MSNLIERIDEHLLTEGLKGGLFDEWNRFNDSLGTQMEKVLIKKLKKAGAKTSWKSKMNGGYAFTVKGYTRSDMEAEVTMNFFVTSVMPNTFKMIIDLKTPEGNSEIWKKEEGFGDYKPEKYASVISQYLGWER